MSNYMTSQEMQGVTHLLGSFTVAHKTAQVRGVSIGDVIVYDSNGESLGVITFEDGQYVFKVDQ